MRAVLIAISATFVVLLASTQPSSAAPFCLVNKDIGGIAECTYHTWQQCIASIGGGGDHCEMNYNGAYTFDLSNPANPRAVQSAPRRNVRERR